MEVEVKNLSLIYRNNMGKKNNNYHLSVIEKLPIRVTQKNIINSKMLKCF
jgi:hypothetical protein